LRDLRARMPNHLLQMLLRGANGVGYTTYPDNVVRSFVYQAAKTGVDVFRVFDSLNWVENMRVAMDAVLEAGKICEGTVCYTGDILDPARAKYDLGYYVQKARELKSAGAHVLGLKDMAGLLKPAAARVLIKALKEEVGLPIHFHTHDTSGIGGATILAACDAGVDAVDAAMDAFSGGTSQPCLGSIVEALGHTPRDTGLDVTEIRDISNYWEQVRHHYAAFESGLPAPASDVYLHEMPGGQFTNLKAQARSLGLEDRWSEVAQAYADANMIFGDIVKVTPSSKVVGDMALMMVSQKLSRAEVEDPAVDVAFPESVVDMLKGNLGQPDGGWPKDIAAKVLKGEPAITHRPAANLPDIDLEATRNTLKSDLKIGLEGNEDEMIDDEDLNGYLMYPKVFMDYRARHRLYGPVRSLPTQTFFFGMEPGEQISVEIDPGKRLEIVLQTVGATSETGDVKVFFELNGQPREIRVPNRSVKAKVAARPKIQDGNLSHIGAPMPGLVVGISAALGATVEKGTPILQLEAMKMQTSVVAERAGKLSAIHVKIGDSVEAKDLVAEIL
jgi:pyruvate carboxylase